MRCRRSGPIRGPVASRDSAATSSVAMPLEHARPSRGVRSANSDPLAALRFGGGAQRGDRPREEVPEVLAEQAFAPPAQPDGHSSGGMTVSNSAAMVRVVAASRGSIRHRLSHVRSFATARHCHVPGCRADRRLDSHKSVGISIASLCSSASTRAGVETPTMVVVIRGSRVENCRAKAARGRS